MLDAIIIGAGYAGMSTAALLADSGLKVAVIEKSPIIGGRASSFTDKEGYTWEYGAHSLRLGPKGIANQVFERLGDPIQFLPPARDAKIIYRSRLWNRPEGVPGFLTNPVLSFKSRVLFLYLLARMKKADPGKWYDSTFMSFCRESYMNDEMKSFLGFLGMTIMCPDPQKASAGEVIDFIQRVLSAGTGVGEPVGGSSQLFSKLTHYIEKNGEIHLNERVTSIGIDGGRVCGVATDRSGYSARRVVFAERLPLLFDIMDQQLFDAAFQSYALGIEHSSSLVFDFITDYPVSDIRGGILGVDIPLWARFQTNSDPSFTPHGKHLSTWGILLPFGFDGNEDTLKLTEKHLKITISKVFPHLLPNLVRERRLVVPVMNGSVLSPAQSRPNRPDIRCPSIKGLFFAGDTVRGDGCSGDISFSSAMKVADAILLETGQQYPGP